MVIIFPLNPFSINNSKDELILEAEKFYKDEKQVLLKYLLDLHMLIKLCPNLDIKPQFINKDNVSFWCYESAADIKERLLNNFVVSNKINSLLKGMVSAFSESVSDFSDKYHSQDLTSLKHCANVHLLDTYLRQTKMLENGIARYAFYAKDLTPSYKGFMDATRTAVAIHESYQQGYDSYLSFNGETYSPLYNDGKVGVLDSYANKTEDMLAIEIQKWFLEAVLSDFVPVFDSEKELFNITYKILEESPYSVCLILSQLIDTIFTPVIKMLKQTNTVNEQNRVLYLLGAAYSKHINWLVKNISSSSYILLHKVLECNSNLMVNEDDFFADDLLPEDIHVILDDDSSNSDTLLLKQQINYSCDLLDGVERSSSPFKLFYDAVNYYHEIEKTAKARNNNTPIADIANRKYLPLFHNSNLDSDFNIKEYRKTLLGKSTRSQQLSESWQTY